MRGTLLLSAFLPKACLVAALSFPAIPVPTGAQGTGRITGTVSERGTGVPLSGVTVTVQGSLLRTMTDAYGKFVIPAIPPGEQVIRFSGFGVAAEESPVEVKAGQASVLDVSLEVEPVRLAELVVTGVSRAPERSIDAPASVAILNPAILRDQALTGLAPRTLDYLPGIDVVQNGAVDFNVNARGFNSSLSRRMVVLKDGRDLGNAYHGNPWWSPDAIQAGDRVELVRGPASALYGANAYNGVVNITSLATRDDLGSMLTLGGGELGTFRGEGRHAGLTRDGRIGYEVSAGFVRSDSWHRSRTRADGSDLRTEYAQATEDSVPAVIETLPIPSQTLDPTTRAGIGEIDPQVSGYGSLRVDYYGDEGSTATVEGGYQRVTDVVFVAGAGRSHFQEGIRPWGRFAWEGDAFKASAWYQSEKLDGVILSSAAPLRDESRTLHGEIQANRALPWGRGRVVLGASARRQWVDTDQTLFDGAYDNRADNLYAAFGQVEYPIGDAVRVIGALRYDDGTLFDGELSPKFAIVFSPTGHHAFRLSASRAFLPASQTDYFLRLALAPPADLSLLEAGLRASPLGPVLAGVPEGGLFTLSSSVPILGLGNQDLDSETVTTFEAGYKGEIADRLFVTVDGYYSRARGFVTDLLPGVNPTYLPWTAPDQVPAEFRSVVEETVADQLVAVGQSLAADGLTRLQDGRTAIVLSFANAGAVDEYGIEVGLGAVVSSSLRLDGSYSLFEFDVDSTTVLPGDRLEPNTPKHRGVLSASYSGANGLDATAAAKFASGFDWSAGVFSGPVPSRQTLDVSVGYQLLDNLRAQVLATNLLDQERFHIYGGSVIRRRILGSLTVTF